MLYVFTSHLYLLLLLYNPDAIYIVIGYKHTANSGWHSLVTPYLQKRSHYWTRLSKISQWFVSGEQMNYLPMPISYLSYIHGKCNEINVYTFVWYTEIAFYTTSCSTSLFLLSDPPSVTNHSQTISVTLGESATLSCPVDGNPKPYITWYKGNVICGTVLSSVNFPNTGLSDSGWYTCFANNSLGTPVSVSLQLLVGE